MSGADDLVTAPARPGLTPTPRFRPTARCFVVNGAGRLLLFGGAISSTTAGGRTWFTPGGGVRSGESLPEAAERAEASV
jgi:8-oxo-dGTP pyrophosphatase MutT (NUDIX family)